MSNKRVRVSDNAGTNWYTLPGNQGEYREELNMVNDTIFGQNFESMNPGLAQWNVTANGIYKGLSGYQAVLKKGGTPTAMTGEATTLVSTRVYRITAAAKRVLSLTAALTVLDGVTDVTAQVLSVDYLNGVITFLGTYTPVGAITVTGTYVPLVLMAKAKSFTLTQTAAPVDASVYEDAQATNGHRTFQGGLITIGLQLNGVYSATNAWLTTLLARGVIFVEVDLDASNPGQTIFRGMFKAANKVNTGNQGSLEEENIQLNLYVPDGSLVVQPFGWYLTSSTLNTAIQKVLTAFMAQANSGFTVQYLPSGVTGASPLDGITGTVIPAECTLANTVEGLNTFSFNFRGTGQPTAV